MHGRYSAKKSRSYERESIKQEHAISPMGKVTETRSQ